MSPDVETAAEDPAVEAEELAKAGVVHFCSVHDVDIVPDSCGACRAVSRMLRPAVLRELIRTKKTGQG